jgi:hypothetical protein
MRLSLRSLVPAALSASVLVIVTESAAIRQMFRSPLELPASWLALGTAAGLLLALRLPRRS